MIFVTVGTQLPFDRLIKIVDQLATKVDTEIFGQVGSGEYKPKNIKWQHFYEPDELDRVFKESKVIISHAGMGTIINCLRMQKPIIIFPRLSALGEHRNDHQLDTLESFKDVRGIYPAKDKNELSEIMHNYKSLLLPKGLNNPERDWLCEYVISLL